MLIRRLGPADVEAFRSLQLWAYGAHADAFTATVEERAAKPQSFWLARVNEAADAQELCFGAFSGQELVGSAGLIVESRPKNQHKALLVGMVVRPEVRGQGVGALLVEAVLKEARARPRLQRVNLTVTEGNGPAERLYARHGFLRWGVEPGAIRDPQSGRLFNKVHMQCVLTESS